MAGILVPTASSSAERNVVRPLHDDPITAARVTNEIGDRNTAFASNAAPTARRNGGAATERSDDGGNIPHCKRNNPMARTAYRFDELEDIQTGRDATGRTPAENRAKRAEFAKDRRDAKYNPEWNQANKSARAYSEPRSSNWSGGNNSWKGYWEDRYLDTSSGSSSWNAHDYNAESSHRNDSRRSHDTPWHRETQYEERSAKRRSRYESHTPSREYENDELFHEGDGSDNSARLRPMPPAYRDVRPEYRSEQSDHNWTPTLRENRWRKFQDDLDERGDRRSRSPAAIQRTDSSFSLRDSRGGTEYESWRSNQRSRSNR